MSNDFKECYILTIQGKQEVIEAAVKKFTSPDDTPEEIEALRAEASRYINEKARLIARKYLFASNGHSSFPAAGART